MSVEAEIIKRTEYARKLPPSFEVADALYKYGLYAKVNNHDVQYALYECWAPAKKVIEALIMEKSHGTWLQLDGYCLEHKQESQVLNLYYNILKEESPYNFESFIYYMEKNRPLAKRFYAPRRKTLKVVVDDLSDLDNGKYKFYGLSMPSRTGKSTLCIFFLTWIACKRPNSHSAMGGHSGILAKGFYTELLNLILTDEYTFKELFIFMHPEYETSRFPTKQSAEEFSITLGDKDRFATITCRGIDGTWTGAIDVSDGGYLYVDDLVRDREHSLSPVRMENTFQEYLNKMVDRKSGSNALGGAKELMVGTLWNVLDPLERISKQYADNPEYKFRRIPALNDNDESNFNYDINGFTTQFYRDMRERLDNAEWMAKYQQQPYVREGLLYEADELNYFYGYMPDGDYRTVAVVDVAYGGGDSLSMPVAREYADGSVYVFAWVFSNGSKETTIPKVVGMIMNNEIRQVRFEGNQGGDMYCQYVDEELKKQGYKCACTSRKAPNNMAKVEKIIAYAGDIKRKYYFLASKIEQGAPYMRNGEYQKAMDELCSFVTIGKNPHDDAVDGLTQLEMFIEGENKSKVEVIKNPFRSMW